MESLCQDLRYALRMLRRSPGFASIAILTLALGIGANTAIFTLLNALLYRELPVPHADQLVELRIIFHNGQHVAFSLPMFQELQQNQKVFSGMLSWSGGGPANVEVDGKLSRDNLLCVSGHFYSELGQRPVLGRLIEPGDANPSAPISQVAVISYEFWRSRFGEDRAVLGKQIAVEGHAFTIIGVTQKGFAGLNTGTPPQITVPITAWGLTVPSLSFQVNSGHLLWLSIIGRLKDGVSLAQARGQLNGIWPGIVSRVLPSDEKGEMRQRYLSMGLYLESAARGPGWEGRARYWRPLYYLMGIVILMLLVVCVNLASLMVARGAGRMHETSVRLALGAGPLRMAMQTFAEGLLLSSFGALLGLAFAFFGTRWIFVLLTRQALAPIAINLHPDFRVLAFTAAVGILTAILFGLTPALSAAFASPAALLRQDSRTFAGRSRLGEGLIVTQIGLSLMLVFASALFTRSFWNLSTANPGFERTSVLTVLAMERPGVPKHLDASTYERQLIDDLTRLPGVRAVGMANFIPGTGEAPSTDNVAPVSAAYVSKGPLCKVNAIGPHFFDAIGMRMVQGRSFAWNDGPRQAKVVILSSSLARKLFPHGDAVGTHVRIGVVPDWQNLEVVGVVSDARLYSPREAHPLTIFLDSMQFSPDEPDGELFVRAAQNPLSLAPAVSRALDSFGYQFAVRSMTLEEAQGQALIEQRLSAIISSFFAGFALLLACMGLYGLISHNVMRRTREIGIRMAVGAQRRDIARLVLRQAIGLSLAGIILGVIFSLGASRLISATLYGISPNDALSIGGASLVLLAIGFVAGYVPARRAMRVDPMVALRHE